MSDVPRLRTGDYFGGLDLGKKQDPSALAIVRKEDDVLALVGLRVWPLETNYTSIAGFLSPLFERIKHIHQLLIDETGVGVPFVEEAKKNFSQVEGITLTLPVKQEILGYLKMAMQEKRLSYAHEDELENELNIERFELTKAGQVQFSHPSGTHDDRLWAVALAVYATRTKPPPQFKPISKSF